MLHRSTEPGAGLTHFDPGLFSILEQLHMSLRKMPLVGLPFASVALKTEAVHSAKMTLKRCEGRMLPTLVLSFSVSVNVTHEKS